VLSYQTDGITLAGSPSNASVNLPSNGHDSKFAGELIGSLPAGFTGVFELRSTIPFVALTLRSLTNSRGDFLLTAFPVADANVAPPSPIVFPHIADGGGYQTQFILIGPTGAASVTVSFWSDSGAPLNIAP
jgi:hypothetical protein